MKSMKYHLTGCHIDKRKHEQAARDQSGGPLASSVQCARRRHAQREAMTPPPRLQLISSSPGLCANELLRFAQFELPQGTHRIPDSLQHLKVPGIPYAIVNRLNETAFLDDGYSCARLCVTWTECLRVVL